MNPSEIIAEIAKLGVALRVEGANLVHRGPRGALRPEHIAKLKAHKPAIVAELDGRPMPSPPTAAPSPRPAMVPGRLLATPIIGTSPPLSTTAAP